MPTSTRPKRFWGVAPDIRFWAKVNKASANGCWEWTAGCNKNGYGTFGINSHQTMLAHRFAYTLSHGPIPKGMKVCHTCDNRKCVRDEHLVLGTHAWNMADMVAKKRQRPPLGERAGAAKLTEEQVRDIRRRHANDGDTYNSLAREYGLSKTQIRRIVLRHKWRHVA